MRADWQARLIFIFFSVFISGNAFATEFETLPLIKKNTNYSNSHSIQAAEENQFDLSDFHQAVMAEPTAKKWMKRVGWVLNLAMIPEFYSMGTDFTDSATKDLGIKNRLPYKIFFGFMSAAGIASTGGESAFMYAGFILPEHHKLQKYLRKENMYAKVPARIVEQAIAGTISGFSGPSIAYLFHLQYKSALKKWIYPADVVVGFSSAFSFMSFLTMAMRPLGDIVINRFGNGDDSDTKAKRTKLLERLNGVKNNLELMNKNEVSKYWKQFIAENSDEVDDGKVLMALLNYSNYIEKQKTISVQGYTKTDIALFSLGVLLASLSSEADGPLGLESFKFFSEMIFDSSIEALNLFSGGCNIISMLALNTMFTGMMVMNGGRWAIRKFKYIYNWYTGELDEEDRAFNCNITARDVAWAGINMFALTLSLATGTSAIYIAISNLTSSLIFNALMITSTVIGNTLPNTQGFYAQVNRFFGVDKQKFEIMYMINRYVYAISRANPEYIQAIHAEYQSKETKDVNV